MGWRRYILQAMFCAACWLPVAGQADDTDAGSEESKTKPVTLSCPVGSFDLGSTYAKVCARISHKIADNMRLPVSAQWLSRNGFTVPDLNLEILGHPAYLGCHPSLNPQSKAIGGQNCKLRFKIAPDIGVIINVNTLAWYNNGAFNDGWPATQDANIQDWQESLRRLDALLEQVFVIH